MVILVAFSYLVWKLVLRALVGKEGEDSKRGWGLETFIAAAVHQLFAASLGLCSFLVTTAGGATTTDGVVGVFVWLTAPHSARVTFPGYRLERLFSLGFMVEMVTDVVFYYQYRGFNRQYALHHLFTFLTAYLFFVSESAPVGYLILWSAVMEIGGMVLNIVSVCRMVRSEIPLWLYDLRTVAYCSSRVIAAVVLAFATPVCSWAGLCCAWAVMAVNAKWVMSMVTAQRGRTMTAFGTPEGKIL